MYELEAVIARAPVLRALNGRAKIVQLDQGWSMLPMTRTVIEAMAVDGGAELDGFRVAPAGFGSVLAACSVHGPLAYVEADFFGGVGSQAAQVWDGGKSVLGPLLMDDADEPPPGGSPISRALRHLGVVAAGSDEFEAVGLGRQRETDDWVDPPKHGPPTDFRSQPIYPDPEMD